MAEQNQDSTTETIDGVLDRLVRDLGQVVEGPDRKSFVVYADDPGHQFRLRVGASAAPAGPDLWRICCEISAPSLNLGPAGLSRALGYLTTLHGLALLAEAIHGGRLYRWAKP